MTARLLVIIYLQLIGTNDLQQKLTSSAGSRSSLRSEGALIIATYNGMSSTVARAPAPLLPPLGRSESEDGVESLEVDGGQARAALAAITADEKANPFFGGSLSRMFGPKSPKSPADLHEAKPTAPFPRRAVSLDSALTPDAETENKPRQDVGFFGRLAPKGRRTPSECEKMVASSHLASSEASTEPEPPPVRRRGATPVAAVRRLRGAGRRSLWSTLRGHRGG